MVERPGPVLVTGANSGFGLAATLRFAERGWPTWGTVRSRAKAKVLADHARAAGVGDLVHPLLLDVSDHDAVVARWPRLPDFYAIVNNAGYERARCGRGGVGCRGEGAARREPGDAGDRLGVCVAGHACSR